MFFFMTSDMLDWTKKGPVVVHLKIPPTSDVIFLHFKHKAALNLTVNPFCCL